MKNSLWIVICIAGLTQIGSFGCSKSKQPSGLMETPQPMTLAEIVPQDGLDKLLRFDDVLVESGPPLKVSLSTRSTNKKRDVHIQYKFEFFDAYGKVTNPRAEWHFITLPASLGIELSGVSISEQSKSWRLILREAR